LLWSLGSVRRQTTKSYTFLNFWREKFLARQKIELGMKKIVTINVGKNGITENLIKEVNFQLEKHGIVKVKLLSNFRSKTEKKKKELAEEIASKIKGKLVDFRGFVLTFERC